MTYAIVRGLARLLLALFYRRIEIRGLERVPSRGPLVIAANHHNALVDAMLLLATIPRRLAPLAKAPLFAHPFVAPFLWLVGAIPVHRRQDANAGDAHNAAMFAKTEFERYDKDAGRTSPITPHALRGGVVLALGLPLALLGMIVHGAGYRATTIAVRALRPDADVSATYQLLGGLLLFPLSWIVEAIVLARAFGPWAVWLFAGALIPTGFFALSWRDRLQRFPREFRAAISGRRDVGLAARRRWLRYELMALDRLTRT